VAILREHIPYYVDIFDIECFLNDPVLVIGVQDCIYYHYSKKMKLKRFITQRLNLYLQFLLRKSKFSGATYRRLREIPARFKCNNLQEILKNYGMHSVKTMDLFDDRSDFQHDMNYVIPPDLKGQFNTVMDIGCVEHIFDTRQALWNLFDLVKVGGHLFIQTVCNGYYKHGLHTFNPECLLKAIELNGFSFKYVNFSTPDGIQIKDPKIVCDALIWIVVRKEKNIKEYTIPQQGGWELFYQKA
jgi:hypothetical protein